MFQPILCHHHGATFNILRCHIITVSKSEVVSVHAMNLYGSGEGIAPTILNLCV